ncbi:MAG: phosphopyruvate hydratase [bacterium]|nr:phosphopyruvate hydratase [bacterium]
MKIKSVIAMEILDSRSSPTVATTALLEDGSIGWAAVPSGASTGKYEAVELRDNDLKRYNGLGVLKAVENVNTKISTAINGIDASDQKNIDQVMIDLDGTKNKTNLGANAILSVSMAAARAEANSEKKPLYEYLSKFNPDHKGIYTMPIPQMNVMNGGKHANWATDIQEFMIFPLSAKSTTDAIRMGSEIYIKLKQLLNNKNYSINVGDEGGFAPFVRSNKEPFELLLEAIKNAGYSSTSDVFLGIDGAASEFYKNSKYILKKENKIFSTIELVDFYKEICNKYPIISLEDIFDQDDWEGFRLMTDFAENKRQIVGDDLYVTNISLLQKGIDLKTTNSILIKLNQIGTVSETVDTILLARKNNFTSVVSHRSGETEDTFIADFVVAMGTGQIKTGAPARSERVAKYNRLMAIEKELGDKATYARWPFSI